tara:strand:- start:356 stop:1294 length:939 start_codon:yes stop_codon:yes gene_type:complete
MEMKIIDSSNNILNIKNNNKDEKDEENNETKKNGKSKNKEAIKKSNKNEENKENENNEETKENNLVIKENQTQTQIKKEKEINKWTKKKQLKIEKLVYKLKYNRVINNFFFFELKARENFFSWAIILISTLITTLNLLDNVHVELFPYYFLLVKIIMTLFSTIVTLIAAWMKKQQYIERINIIDRYNQKLNKLIEEVEIQLTLLATDRDSYDVFKEKYQPQITEYLSSSPAISPTEWKDIVYRITVYYPELISQDGVTENKLWPWHAVELENGNIVRTKTNFGEKIIKTYGLLHNPRKICCCCCIRKKEAIT